MKGRPPRIAIPGLGAALRERRMLHGWSQEAMELEMRERGTPMVRGILSRYERGEQTPGIIPLRNIARALGVTVDTLLEEADNIAAMRAQA